MGTPHTAVKVEDPAGSTDSAPALPDDHRLTEIDTILEGLTRRDRETAADTAGMLDARTAFLREFAEVCRRQIRPAMTAVLDRLRSDGGSGLIEEHPGGEPRVSTPRLTLWMSLQGDIDGGPRPDRHPYLQFDAEVDDRSVKLTEGDMWRGTGGGHSGSIGAWQLPEITQDRVVQELLTIMRRAASSTDTEHP